MVSIATSQRRVGKGILITTVTLLFTLVLSACNGSSLAQQKAILQKAHLDALLAHARTIGVPGDMLQTITGQEQQISQTSAPFTAFNDQPLINYYDGMAQRYQILAVQVAGLQMEVTQQYEYQAYLDMRQFESALAERQAENLIETKAFADQFVQDQSLLANAQYPKDYLHISYNVRRATEALHLMGTAYSDMQSLQHTAQQLQALHVDTTAVAQEQQNDLALFRTANKPEDFIFLIDVTNTQLQEATVLATQAMPYFGAYEGAIKLQEFSAVLEEGRKYRLDETTFQQRFHADQANLAAAQGTEYSSILAQIDNDIAAMQIPLARAKANFYLQQFEHEVAAWGSRYQYWDSYNNHVYRLDYEYDKQGVGSDVEAAVQAAQTVDDYQGAIAFINTNFRHLKAMEQDYSDRTSWNQPHAADLALMQDDGVTGGSVIVVSLVEQALRFYQDGKLVAAFQITSGQYDRPSPPGLWSIFLRQHPTEFKSSDPMGSAFWYPPTRIEYAMEYHGGGYFFHDSWWRVNYGAGTNFPHYDTGGDETFAGNGSHGCINMVPGDAAWLYNHTGNGMTVILY